MHPDLSPQAIHVIETLCAEGCTYVNQLLDNARDGRRIEALDGFRDDEVVLILEELAQIMAVYEKE